MSTFKGVVDEFPYIRIDYFCQVLGKTPPLACFLSHVHSDHLRGLESLRSPFIYCSSATRELLLRLEQYPHRMNFAKGILESRRVHYKHLNSLLKPIPLHTPTEIELGPDRSIRVTLFDANHCTGAVMFLIENSTKAVLYTGDIRAESWWVNSLTRNPILLPYTLGDRRLDKLYLDTSFAVYWNRHQKFPSKAEGLAELLKEISAYPNETVFHFNAWTFGYEEVWQALASALNSKVHVDRYKMRLYSSLNSNIRNGIITQEGAALCGFKFGNRVQDGCLTNNVNVKIHSCERGIGCTALNNPHVVSIVPIIARADDGSNLEELGVGGGSRDLLQSHELDLGDTATTVELIKLCSENITDDKLRTRTLTLITQVVESDSNRISLKASQSLLNGEEVPLLEVVKLLQQVAGKSTTDEVRRDLPIGSLDGKTRSKYSRATQPLPRLIKFPYSRHSSYDELCNLVGCFKPKDVYPCTVDEKNWDPSISMETLFGHLCSSKNFAHDQHMLSLSAQQQTSTSKNRSLAVLDAGDNGPQSSQRTEFYNEATSQGASSSTPGCITPSRQRIEELPNDLHQPKRRYSNTAACTSPENVSTQSSRADVSNDGFSDTSMDRHVQVTREAFEEGLRHLPIVTKVQRQTSAAVTDISSSLKGGKTSSPGTEIIAFHGSTQQSIPTAPDKIPSYHIGSWSKKSSPTPAEPSADPVLSNSSSGSACITGSDDIALLKINNPILRAETNKAAVALNCSIIMASTWLKTLAYVPTKSPSVREFKHQVRIAKYRTKRKRMNDEPEFKELARKIKRLQNILPVADEESCFFSLNKCNGDFPKARDFLARRLVTLAKRSSQPSSEASDGANEETQVSLQDASFDSQSTTIANPIRLEAKIEQRKEAYKTAQGLHGRQWTSYSSIFRDFSFQEEETELG